jgi:putative ABC transport system ATP-binding protein
MPIIELKDVSKIYGFGDATTVALDEVTLDIEKGEFLAVMGPSGSGKTTLLNIIGLLDRSTHGDYTLDGKDVAKVGQNRRARVRRDNIGFIFQFFNLLPKLNVLDNVALPLAYKGVTLGKRTKKAKAALEQVNLESRAYYFPRQLSGGQLQRAAIARALVNKPGIIIADEPTGNLDTNATQVVMELLSDIHKLGSTIIMVTHNPSLTRYATRLIYMRDGQIVHDEASAVGQIPDRVKSAMRSITIGAEESKLASVSASLTSMEKEKTKPKRKTKAKRK